MMFALRFRSACATPAACIARSVASSAAKKRGAVGELPFVLPQRRPRDVLEREVLAVDEAVSSRHAGHARELLVYRVLAAQQKAVQSAERSRGMCLFHDHVARGRRVELDRRLIAAAEQVALAARDRVVQRARDFIGRRRWVRHWLVGEAGTLRTQSPSAACAGALKARFAKRSTRRSRCSR